MKNILFLICISFFSLSWSNTDSIYCYKWEGISIDGHYIFGISKTKEGALIIIKDFIKRNANTSFKIHSYIIRKSKIDQISFDIFLTRYPRKYRVLKKLDMAAIRLFKITNFEKAVTYISDLTKQSKEKSIIYVQRLLKECQIYRLTERGL